MALVTKANRSAKKASEEFEKAGPYKGYMCGERLFTKKGEPKRPSKARINEDFKRLESLDKFLLTEKDRKFFWSFYEKHSVERCCLPRDHEGVCRKFIRGMEKSIQNKLKDCFTAPGQDEIIFKNRCARTHPIQLSGTVERELKKNYHLKRSTKLKFAVPISQAGTGYTCATALFDYYALLTIQQGDPLRAVVDEASYAAFSEHLGRLEASWLAQGVRIRSAGVLGDPFTLEPLSLEWWTHPDPARSNPKQVQFGHVQPVSDARHGTHGGNVLPLTRRTNMMQGDMSFSEMLRFLGDTLALHEALREGKEGDGEPGINNNGRLPT